MISETRRRLKEWGIWACGGDPQVSSMFKVMFGRGAQSLTYMPDHIQEVDHIICTSPPDLRAILIKFYTQGGTIQDKALSIGLDRRTLMRRVDRADWYVHSRLDMLPAVSASSRQNEFGVTKLRRRASEPASRKAHNPERPFNSAARFHSPTAKEFSHG